MARNNFGMGWAVGFILVLLSLQPLSCQAESRSHEDLSFVQTEIDRQDVEVSTGPLVHDGCEVHLMVGAHYVDLERRIFDAAVIYSSDQGEITVHGKFLETQILDADGELLFDAASAPHPFYGWTMRVGTVDGSGSIAVSIDAYFDRGTSVTDLPNIRWDGDEQSLVWLERYRADY